MNFLKIKLLVIALIMFAASSAFASLGYDVTVDTSSLFGQSGYLYLQYIGANAASSTSTVSNFTTDGTLALSPSAGYFNGSAGTLTTGAVTLSSGGTIEGTDYNHGITFGNTVSFLVSFPSLASGGTTGGVSTFSLGLYSDASGITPLLNINGGNYAGTVALVNLMNDGTTSAQSLDSTTTATPTPIPAAAWLLGSGLMGLVGLRRKK
jgi:hypothetical protein